MVTYKDIREQTGLSLATISKYYNGRNVLPSSREAIEAAAASLNYRPNAVARSLRSRQSGTVGVLLPALTNEFHLTIIAAVEQYLRSHGMSVIVASSPVAEDHAVDLLLSRMVDGIVAVPSLHDVAGLKRAAERIPVIAIDWDAPELDIDGVYLDNTGAGLMAARYLVDHGHTRIALVDGEPDVSSVRQRAEGFAAELDRLGFPLPANMVRSGPLTVEHGHNAVRDLLLEALRPTAFFSANQELTIGALIALNESGLRVGRDVSLLGFDSANIAPALTPALTVIEQPAHEIANAAAELLLKRLHPPSGAKTPAVRKQFGARLRAGGSVMQLRP